MSGLTKRVRGESAPGAVVATDAFGGTTRSATGPPAVSADVLSTLLDELSKDAEQGPGGPVPGEGDR